MSTLRPTPPPTPTPPGPTHPTPDKRTAKPPTNTHRQKKTTQQPPAAKTHLVIPHKQRRYSCGGSYKHEFKILKKTTPPKQTKKIVLRLFREKMG
ncbi:hypothetical protein ACVGXN_01250, partial [Enterobacter hormaechei]